MNSDIFTEWLRQQGQHVVITESSCWHSQGPRVYQAFPYHWIIQPSKEELSSFLRQTKAIGLRYSTPIDADIGQISYHAVYEQATYDINNLGKWARKNVRIGLRSCTIEPIPFERMAEEGWLLQIDTLERQGRKLNLDQGAWRRRCLSAGNLPGFEGWGALVDGKLAASVITFQMANCCYMLYQQCHRDYLSKHINNALSFVVTQEMIKRPEIHSILYGLHSLDAPASVDEFKFRMGYAAKPVRQRVVFHPWIAPLINSTSHTIVQRLHNWLPKNPTLAKTEGVLRFYLEGNQPLSNQHWPECLTNHETEIQGA